MNTYTYMIRLHLHVCVILYSLKGYIKILKILSCLQSHQVLFSHTARRRLHTAKVLYSCLSKSNTFVLKKDGVWSSWEAWSNCSVKCGGGVKRRQRQCNNLTSTGLEKPCAGNYEQTDVCNTQLCEEAFTHLSGITGTALQ